MNHPIGSRLILSLIAVVAMTVTGCSDDCSCDDGLFVSGPLTPVITFTSASPQAIPLEGNDPVQLVGTGFEDCGGGIGSIVDVQVGNKVVQGTIISDTEIQILAPEGDAPGFVDAAILCPEGVVTLINGLEYNDPVPTVELNLNAGCFDTNRPVGEEGTTIQATVMDFPVTLNGTETITVGGIAADNIMLIDADTIQFDVPNGLTAGDVVDVIVTQGANVATGTAVMTVCGPIAPGILVLNEFMVRPNTTTGNNPDGADTNNDGVVNATADEFAEIVNTGNVPIDISGYILNDIEFFTAMDARHTFPDGTLVPAGGAIVVFGSGTPTGFPSNVIAQTATTGALGYKDSSTGDSIILHSPDFSTEYFRYDYLGSGVPGAEWMSGISLQNPEEGTWGTGGMPFPMQFFVQHNVQEAGVDFSPGTKTDGTAFP